MPDNTKDTTVLQMAASRLIGVLCSMKLAIVALLLVGIISIAGALIPQNANHNDYVQLYGTFLSLILTKTGLTNVFGSWWFMAMVAYLVASMTFCSLKRLPQILQTAKQKNILLEQSEYEQSEYYNHFTLQHKNDLTAENVRDRFSEILQKSRYKVTDSLCQDGTYYVAASKGHAGLFGPFLIHLSLIVISIGAAFTAANSYSYFLHIAVGESLPLPDTPYSVQLHDFIVKYYKGTDRPSEYTSVLSITQNGRPLGDGKLAVNKPLTIAGMSFYQMTYNPIVSDVTITVARRQDNKELGKFKLPIGQETYIEELGLSINPVDFLPDFALTSDGVAVSRTPNFKNPAVFLDISIAEKTKVSKWVFHSASGYHLAAAGDYVFGLKDYTTRTVSGIKIIRDRAIPLVYTGFFLLTVGTFLSCYIFYRRVWIMVIPSQNQIKLSIAGKCNRNILDFRRELSKCIERTSLFDKETSE